MVFGRAEEGPGGSGRRRAGEVYTLRFRKETGGPVCLCGGESLLLPPGRHSECCVVFEFLPRSFLVEAPELCCFTVRGTRAHGAPKKGLWPGASLV